MQVKNLSLLVLLASVVVASGCVASGYTLTVQDPSGEGEVDPKVGKHQFSEGEELRVQAKPSRGWNFSHWEGDVDQDYADNKVLFARANRDLTVKPVFKPIYSLNIGDLEGKGSISVRPDQKKFTGGESVNLVADPDLGWEFSHWEGDINSNNSKETKITINKDKKIKPVFEKAFSGGSGTDSDPFEISNINQLQKIENYPKYHFELVNDIDASQTEKWNSKKEFRNEYLGYWDKKSFETLYSPIVEGSETIEVSGIKQTKEDYQINYENGIIEFYSEPKSYMEDPTISMDGDVEISYETKSSVPRGFEPLFQKVESQSPYAGRDIRGNEFVGSFNGNNYTIRNLYIDRPQEVEAALFEHISRDAEIRNLHIENVKLAGLNEGLVDNVATSGSIEGSAALVVENIGEIINSSSNATLITNSDDVGLVSKTDNRGQIINSEFNGEKVN